jgi:KDO2-lipid IV(A) lauroyltransferase
MSADARPPRAAPAEDHADRPAAIASAAAQGSRPPAAPVSLTVRLQAALVRGLARLLRLFPVGAVASLGAAAGDLYGLLARRRRRIAIENLTAAMGPDVPPERIHALARASFRHFGRAAFEMITMDRYSEADARDAASAEPGGGGRLRFEGLAHVQEVYARGRGVLFFTGHYGNWEVSALLHGYLGLPLAVIARPLDNPLLETFLRTLREASGNRVISKRSAVRQTLRAISEGMGVAIVIDQNVRSGARVFVDFFGRLASTTPTLALLALKTGAPLIPVFSIPGPDGSYRIVFGRELTVTTTGDRDADVLALTQTCTRIIEEQVRARPDCWLWMHERWKTRP